MKRMLVIAALLACGSMAVSAQDVLRVEHDGRARVSHDAGKTWSSRFVVSVTPENLGSLTVAQTNNNEDAYSLKRPIHCTSTASIPSIITCYDSAGRIVAHGDGETPVDDRFYLPVVVAQPPPPLQVVVTCRASAAICARLFDAFAAAYGYQDTVPNPAFDPTKPQVGQNTPTIPNPQTKKEFMELRAEAYIREVAATTEAEAAAKTARDQKKAELEGALKRAQGQRP